MVRKSRKVSARLAAAGFAFLALGLAAGDGRAASADGIAYVPKTRAASTSNPGCVFSVQMDPIARCVTICANGIPVAGTVTRVIGLVRSAGRGEWEVCGAGKKCGPGKRSWFLDRPVTTVRNGQKEVCWAFKSWNHTGPLEAKIVVEYE